MISEIIDFDTELAAVEARATQLRQACDRRRNDLQCRVASLQQSLAAIGRPDDKLADANALPHVRELCRSYNRAHAAYLEHQRRYAAASQVERSAPEWLEKQDAQEARLRQECQAAQAAYSAAVSAETERIIHEYEATKAQATVAAAEVRAAIAAAEAELARLATKENAR